MAKRTKAGINSKLINEKISKSPEVRKAAYAKANEKFKKQKAKMINEFMAHPVTQEIQSGPSSTNLSGTLRGYGNLFSYIGFSVGSDPIGPILSMMENVFSLSKRPKKVSVSSKNIRFMYNVIFPDMTDFENVSSMPWEGGSWVSGIERRISGYSHYMYKRASASRSKTAIQTKTSIRSGSFKPMTYVSNIIKQFSAGIIR